MPNPAASLRNLLGATRPGPFVVTGRVEEQLGGLAVNVSELTLAGAIEHKSQPQLVALARMPPD